MQQHRVRRGHQAAPRIVGRMPLSTEAAISRKIRFICFFGLLGLLSLATQPGFAQSPPLNLGNNFFVTGDYIVAGAYGINTNFTKINGVSYTTGVISVPDPNPGITGANQVPKGAQIVAALLYWQTIEKAGVAPGATGSGQNGYIRPLFFSKTGGPAAPGYAFSGTNVSPSSNVSWGPGGCSGTFTGNVRQTYRADVAGALPLDANGNPTANGFFEVRLPSAGEPTPFTLGATLVVIYRILSGAGGPNIPLNSIVIYDGDYAAAKPQLTMTQQLQGFYDAAHNPVSRLTHIVGNGDDDSYETVYLNSKALPSLYGRFLPPFPGYYRNWDNPTWTFTSASQNPANPVMEDSSSATTQVVPSSRVDGCVSWGAVIVSTTVKNSDNDGILDSWKTNQGYCDYAVNPSCTGPQDGGWIPLPGAAKGQKDIFLQYDFMCSKVNGPPQDPNNDNAKDNSCAIGGNDYSFDPRQAEDQLDGLSPHTNAAQKVVETFNNHKGSPGTEPFVLHAMPGNAISESQAYDSKGNIVPATCNDTDLTCPFPNEPGTVGFREGLAYIKNQTIEPQTGLLGCDPNTNTKCVAVFPHGKKDSYHYALFSHGVGLPNWFLSDGSIQSVSQTGSTVTFTTSSPHGISPIIAGDSLCSFAKGYLGRVTIVFAITNQNLNGTYCAKPVGNPASSNKFSITLSNSSTTANYTVKTDPNLAVANGQVTSMSGYSDVGGQNSVISLGYGGWGPPNNPASEGNKWNIKAGTFMHELGHTLALTHGGTFYNKVGSNPPDYTPTFEVNCKPNVQSVMSYAFQFDLLQAPGPANQSPVKVLDYSEDPQSPGLVNTLTENSPQPKGYLTGLSYPYTSWFQLSSGPVPPSHCDGTPTVPNENAYSYTNQPVGDFFWGVDPITNKLTGNDINFNGNANDLPMHPHNEWEGTPAATGVGPSPGVDLRQVSAVGTISTIGPGGEAGGLKPAGGGGGLKPAGGGGGLQPAGGGGGLKPAGGGGGLKPAGGGGLSAEITHNQANSYPRPPQNLFIQQEKASPRFIDLAWFAPSFGTAVQYNIYRSDAGHPFGKIGSVPGSQTTFEDTVTCNLGGYRYSVTAVTNNDQGQPQESSPSNTVPASGEPLLTGCYTAPGNVAVEANGVQGDIVPVTWTLTDDFYIPVGTAWAGAHPGNAVTNLAASTLIARGPLPGNCTSSGPTTILSKGTPQSGASTFVNTNPSTGLFTFNWDTDTFCAGSYTLELDLDSGQTFTSSPLQLSIDVNDQDTPRITTLTLPPGTVGLAYNDTLSEEGGTPPLTWTVSGLPSGISQQPAGSPNLSGTTCVAAGSYAVNATVTDSKLNSGSQAFTLQINKANTTTSVLSNANPSVFQQMVTFTVTVAPQYSCTPTGTVTLSDGGSPIASNLPLTGGIATFTTSALSVGPHSITASYSGDANFNSSNSGVWSQTVNPAQTQIVVNSVSPSPAFVGQPITVSYTFAVVAPGAGSPNPPSGNITVSAGDGSCMAAAVQGAGMCTLSPTPTAAGTYTLTINYPGDGNFVASGFNGNYTVYQLVFTTQPSNTGVGLTMTPPVQVAAQDATNTTLASFTGGITVAIGSGPGTLSGTTTQNAVAGVATFGDLSINKIANGDTLTAAPSGGVPDATSSAFNIDTFYVDNQGNFGTLDLATGVATQIAAGTATGSTGMDLTPGLQVYEYNTSNELVQITPSTGMATPVGPGTIPDQATTGALTDGSYFGIDAVTGNLYKIDLTTGATTQVGDVPTGAAVLPAGCNLDSSLSGSAGSPSVLYYTIGYTGASCTAFPDTLYQIDPTSGATTTGVQVTISGSGVNAFVGSTFVGGTLYGFTAGGQEYTIDPATGVATLLTSTTATAPILAAASSQ